MCGKQIQFGIDLVLYVKLSRIKMTKSEFNKQVRRARKLLQDAVVAHETVTIPETSHLLVAAINVIEDLNEKIITY